MGSSGRPCGGWRLCGLLLCLLCAGVASQESGSGFDDDSTSSSSTPSLSTTETLAPTSTSPATTAPEGTSPATITPATTRATTPPTATEASTPLPETTEAATPLPDPTEEVAQPPDPTEEATPPPDPTEDATPPPEDATPPPNATEDATPPPETTEAATPPPETTEAATPSSETTEASTLPPQMTEESTPPPETTDAASPETTEAPVTESPTPATTPPATTSPETTAPSTDEPPPPTAAPVVERYNSSTLPPGLDPSMLNGSDLVNVEVTETTQEDGSTSYSYVIITKAGETVRTIVLSPESSPATSAPIAASADTAKSGSSLSDTINSGGKSSNSIGIGGIIGIITGALVFTFVVVAFFILERRRSTKGRPSDASSDDIFVPPAVDKQVRLLEQGQAMAETEYADVSRTTANSHSSGGSMPDGRRQRATLWEDPVILASRIPIDRIELGIVIGHGAFGEVYRGRYREHDVAVKTLLPEKRKDMAHIQAFLSEVRTMATMEHPNIVPFIGVAWESLSDLFCVTEYMTGGDLRTLLKDYLAHNVPQGMDATKMQIAYEVAFALTYLHSLQPAMLHRDLKSRNILLTGSLHAKITDFGASRIRSDATMTSNVGSALWMAPEVMMGGHYGEKADVFSLGVVISELDTHELPYSHAKEEGSSSGRSLPDAAVLQMVSMGKLRVRLSSFMHPELVQLVEKCVSVDPDVRPTAAEVVYFLQTAIKNRQY